MRASTSTAAIAVLSVAGPLGFPRHHRGDGPATGMTGALVTPAGLALLLALVLVTIAMMTAPVRAGEGDPAKGATVYKLCRQCHEAPPGDPLAAPRLRGVVGRPVAHEEGYRYSAAMLAKRKEGMIWTEENLRDFIRDPRDFIPGTVMQFVGVKRGAMRDNLLAYLKTLE